MKTLNLTAILASVLLSVSAAAYAEVTVKHDAHSHQFMSKRPYQQTLATKAPAKDQQWEGATYIADADGIDESHLKNQQALRLHNIGKRAF